jgi:hypothetical protein
MHLRRGTDVLQRTTDTRGGRHKEVAMDEQKQVVGGVIPDQEDAGGNFSQTDPGGGLGDRPVVRPYLEPSPSAESEAEAEADRVSGRPSPEPDDGGAAPSALPPDVTGE